MGDINCLKGHLVPIFGILLAISCLSSSIRLGSDGGYGLVVAVKEGSTIPETEQARYIQNIKGSMQAFSNQLWRATKRQFYVNSVEFLLPADWKVDDIAQYAESGSFETADFKVSEDTVYPHAENTNLCGLPGKYVELPLPFFANANANEFGPIWKTLMVLFARYRFGVWEEHGYIDDAKFPYFVPNFLTREVDVTGCNNEPIVGKFIDITDQEECNINFTSPQSSCRFVPDRSNTVSTSLMHFHWMDSVVDFCDESSHNRFAENKQNTFCDRKSVMEVIRTTPDFLKVTNQRTDIPPVNFKTVLQFPKPLFYLLLDKGRLNGSYDVANLIPPRLAEFIRHEGRDDNIMAVGSYPNTDILGSYVKEEIQWSQIGLGDNRDNILKTFGELRLDGRVERDFSRAILEVAGLIKQRNHPHGAVILVVKYGTDLDGLSNSLPESDVIVALNEQKIILHSIELANITEPDIRSHLSRLASATTGGYATLTYRGEAPGAINNVLNFVGKTINASEYVTDQANRKTVTKDIVTSPNGIYAPIPTGSTAMEVFYSSHQSILQSTDFLVRIDGVTITTLSPTRSIDYNQNEGEGVRYSYRFRFNSALITGKKSITLQRNCGVGSPPCDGSMLARADIDITDSTTDIVKIEVSTSAQVVDLSKQIPLSIYAKATKSGTVVIGLIAYAQITNSSGSSIKLNLYDDGNVPDVLENDGTFSAYFVPPPNGDGEYKISIVFEKNPNTIKSSVSESSLGRLLPIDQNPPEGCGAGTCPEEVVNDGFMQIEEVLPVVFSNSSLFEGRPARIFMFGCLPFLILGCNPENRLLTWRSPRVPGFSTTGRVDSYDIRQAPTRDQLINDFQNCEIVAESGGINVNNPGDDQTFQLPNSTTYFAMRSRLNGIDSEISNIIRFRTETDEETPTPGTTTTESTGSTTSPGTGPTTTPDPTGPTEVTEGSTGNPIVTTTDTTTQSPTTTEKNSSPILNSSLVIVVVAFMTFKLR